MQEAEKFILNFDCIFQYVHDDNIAFLMLILLLPTAPTPPPSSLWACRDEEK